MTEKLLTGTLSLNTTNQSLIILLLSKYEKKSDNASPCRYDLALSSVRIFCGSLQGFNRNLIKPLTK